MKDGLLEEQARKMGIDILSDLRTGIYREEILHCLREVEAKAYPLEQWRDVYEYLCHKDCEIQGDAECVKQELLWQLERRR